MTITPADIGKLVRIRPINGQHHWMRGRLVAINGKRAEVLPFTHKHTELFDVDRVRVWKAKQREQGVS